MASTTGNATDHHDLWAKLIDFLTDDVVPAWTVVWTHVGGQKSGVVLQGPGLGGTDEVLIGLRMVERPTLDEFEIQCVGMTGVLDSATTIFGHVNVTPHVVRTFVDNGPQTYWFTGNGRRFAAVIKISTVFEALYAGLILPYSMPDQYSYPLFVGGSAGETDVSGTGSWRSTSGYHRHFVHSYYDTAPTPHYGSAYLLSPQGDWLPCAATGQQTTVGIGPRRMFGGFGTSADHGTGNYGYDWVRTRQRAGFGGQFSLNPITLVQATPSDQTYGVLDGCYHVAGFGNAAENIITAGGLDHLTVQDAFRTGLGEYWAMALED